MRSERYRCGHIEIYDEGVKEWKIQYNPIYIFYINRLVLKDKRSISETDTIKYFGGKCEVPIN